METRVIVALVIIALAVAAAKWLERRRPAPPPRDAYPIPAQLDRADFPRPDAPWLVALFSSRTCDSCVPMAAKVAALESEAVATCDVEVSDEPDLHRRYRIEGVPMVVVADGEGVVRAGFVGNVGADELWAAVAGTRNADASGPGQGD